MESRSFWFSAFKLSATYNRSMVANAQTMIPLTENADSETSSGEAAALKQRALEERLSQLGSLMVAYSGGVDSAFLAATAHQNHSLRRGWSSN